MTRFTDWSIMSIVINGFPHHNRCDYANNPDDPESECYCIDPATNPELECGHRVEDYCYCSEC